MQTIREIYDANRLKRVVIVKRDADSFTFREGMWFDEVESWGILWWPGSICDSEETVLREARGRIGWLGELFVQNPELHNKSG